MIAGWTRLCVFGTLCTVISEQLTTQTTLGITHKVLGLDSAQDCTVEAHGKGVVMTDLSIATPPGTYARVAPRSGLAVKHFIDVGAGVVDEDYRGNVGVVLFNHSSSDFAGLLALLGDSALAQKRILNKCQP